MDRSTSLFAPTPDQAQRRRQVAGALLTVTFCIALYGGTYSFATLLVVVRWCA